MIPFGWLKCWRDITPCPSPACASFCNRLNMWEWIYNTIILFSQCYDAENIPNWQQKSTSDNRNVQIWIKRFCFYFQWRANINTSNRVCALKNTINFLSLQGEFLSCSQCNTTSRSRIWWGRGQTIFANIEWSLMSKVSRFFF